MACKSPASACGRASRPSGPGGGDRCGRARPSGTLPPPSDPTASRSAHRPQLHTPWSGGPTGVPDAARAEASPVRHPVPEHPAAGTPGTMVEFTPPIGPFGPGARRGGTAGFQRRRHNHAVVGGRSAHAAPDVARNGQKCQPARTRVRHSTNAGPGQRGRRRRGRTTTGCCWWVWTVDRPAGPGVHGRRASGRRLYFWSCSKYAVTFGSTGSTSTAFPPSRSDMVAA